MRALLLAISFTIALKEFYELKTHKLKYFRDFENLVQWFLLLTMVVTFLPVMGWHTVEITISKLQYQLAAVS